MNHAEILVAGHFIGGPCDQSVGKSVQINPYTGSVYGTAAEGDFRTLKTAVEAASGAFDTWSNTEANQRAELLERVAQRVDQERERFARMMAEEIGKPVALGRAELVRTALTLRSSAEAARRYVKPFNVDLTADSRSKMVGAAHFTYRPKGVIFGIVPYNWPFNLTAHKLGPALASGNTVVLKPSPYAALSTLAFCRLFHEEGLPEGVLNAVTADPRSSEKALQLEEVSMLSFTGSPKVGWHLKQLLWDKAVTLELGGNAMAYVDEPPNQAWVTALVASAYGYAGQVCISLQNLLVKEEYFDAWRQAIAAEASKFKCEDPTKEETLVGPLITPEAANKVWATCQSSTIVLGGPPDGARLDPILTVGAQPGTPLFDEEIFGPVLNLVPVRGVEQAIAIINGSKYAIHSSCYTLKDEVWNEFMRSVKSAGLLRNGPPSMRFDTLPYGGNRQSGWGREGVDFAYADYCDLQSIVEVD